MANPPEARKVEFTATRICSGCKAVHKYPATDEGWAHDESLVWRLCPACNPIPVARKVAYELAPRLEPLSDGVTSLAIGEYGDVYGKTRDAILKDDAESLFGVRVSPYGCAACASGIPVPAGPQHAPACPKSKPSRAQVFVDGKPFADVPADDVTIGPALTVDRYGGTYSITRVLTRWGRWKRAWHLWRNRDRVTAWKAHGFTPAPAETFTDYEARATRGLMGARDGLDVIVSPDGWRG